MRLWIARDKTGWLGLYKEKPVWRESSNGIEDWNDGCFMSYLDSNTFDDVKFENSPQKVELKLVDL
jgi:hypothetical protein